MLNVTHHYANAESEYSWEVEHAMRPYYQDETPVSNETDQDVLDEEWRQSQRNYCQHIWQWKAWQGFKRHLRGKCLDSGLCLCPNCMK